MTDGIWQINTGKIREGMNQYEAQIDQPGDKGLTNDNQDLFTDVWKDHTASRIHLQISIGILKYHCGTITRYTFFKISSINIVCVNKCIKYYSWTITK